MGLVGINLGNGSCHVIQDKINWSNDRNPLIEAMENSGDHLHPIAFSIPDEFQFSAKHIVNRASQIMHLLGCKLSDPELQSELAFLPFRVTEDRNGYPLIHGGYGREDRAFTPIEILAMLISSLLIEIYPPENSKDHIRRNSYCIGTPTYFTDKQRQDVLEAAKLAGLTSPILLDEMTAMAMVYRISLSARFQFQNVAFVDIGHTSMQVCFAEVRGHKININYKAYVRSLGGRDFDRALFKHFASEIRNEYCIDVYDSAIDCVSLLDASEGMKKDLSKYNTASFCIMLTNGRHVKGSINRKIFENMSTPILKRIKAALQKALHNYGLNTKKDLHVESVGNGCSMPAVMNIVREVFGTEPRKMARSDEHVVIGCAIRLQRPLSIPLDLTTGVVNLESVSIKLPVKGEKGEGPEKRLWIRAMDKQGHSLISICCHRKIRGQKVQHIGRLNNTNEESYWNSKANSSNQKTAIIDKAKNSNSFWKALFWRTKSEQNTDNAKVHRSEDNKMQNQPNNQMEEKPTLQCETLEDQRPVEQLKPKRDKDRKEVELKKESPGDQYGEYFAEFSYSELKDATNKFHESFKLGQGGFGIVYKGFIHKTTVAIKMLKAGSSQGTKEFNTEVEILSKVRHPNLVTLIGACKEKRALIYEYLPNGSLEDRLNCKGNTPPLSWQNRVRIAFEMCSALNFLHCSKPHGIVHGDLKPENILLDSNNVSKISDFGLSRQLYWTDSVSVPYHVTECLKGTFAYMDPEYFQTYTLTPHYDIYAFGIILLRLVTCKDPRGIRGVVEKAQEKGRPEKLIDSLAGAWPIKEGMKMISLGLRCSHPIRKHRPDLSTVWSEIESMVDVASASKPSLFAQFIRSR